MTSLDQAGGFVRVEASKRRQKSLVNACTKWAQRESGQERGSNFFQFDLPDFILALHCNTLHYTSFPICPSPLPFDASFHYTTIHYTTLHCTALHCTALHYTALHYTTLHYTTLHYTTLHYTTLHYTTLHYTTLQCLSTIASLL